MKTYALYSNGRFVVAKNFFEFPTVNDFGVGEIPTSSYKVMEVCITPTGEKEIVIPATINVD